MMKVTNIPGGRVAIEFQNGSQLICATWVQPHAAALEPSTVKDLILQAAAGDESARIRQLYLEFNYKLTLQDKAPAQLRGLNADFFVGDDNLAL
jgi:hypothetical protein